VDVHDFDPLSATEAQRRSWYDLDAALELEHIGPDAPVTPYEETMGWLLHQVAVRPQMHRVVLDGERVVGASRLSWWTNKDDRNADITVGVAATHRRRGIGAALLRRTAEAAREAGRELASMEIAVGATGEPFVERLGAKRCSVERRSLCRTAEVDRDLLRGWIAAAPSGEYDLVHWRGGGTPEELLQELCRVMESINDAPLDDLTAGRVAYDGQVIRDFEDGASRRGQAQWVWCAVQRETGRMAGVTEMLTPSRWPEMAYQGNTAVDPAHRRRGIGRWIKAALLLALLEERPSTRWVQTWNARSNAEMLGINVAMGFRPAEEWGIWQLPLDRLLERLEEQACASKS
jgi:GNAT superfamily N-acetyltransferase